MADRLQILQGDALEMLKTLPSESVHCCVTSPPYFGLRDYGAAGQVGVERTPDEYVTRLVEIFREVRRVLRKDGTLWLNLGDSYAGSGCGWGGGSLSEASSHHAKVHGIDEPRKSKDQTPPAGMKPKDLMGIPWLVAFALRSDGWYLRSDIVWAKKNCMPESVTDRPTRSHEFMFLLSKSARYYYDYEAIKEPAIYDVDGTGTASRKARAREELKSFPTAERSGIRATGFKDAAKMNGKNGDKQRGHSRRHAGFNDRWDLMEKEEQCSGMRNKRDVWTVAPAIYPDAHFATYPPDLIIPCILAGCPMGGTVLDPFAGSGTTGKVAIELGRQAILIELNPEYIKLIEKRCTTTMGLPLTA